MRRKSVAHLLTVITVVPILFVVMLLEFLFVEVVLFLLGLTHL